MYIFPSKKIYVYFIPLKLFQRKDGVWVSEIENVINELLMRTELQSMFTKDRRRLSLKIKLP